MLKSYHQICTIAAHSQSIAIKTIFAAVQNTLARYTLLGLHADQHTSTKIPAYKPRFVIHFFIGALHPTTTVTVSHASFLLHRK